MPVVRRVLSALLGIVASLVGTVAVSSATGGPLTWVTTEGSSMLPSVPPGTLAVLQRRPAYEVGDVVGYRNADLGRQVVLHRVVGVDGGTYRLRGDNNGWDDPYRPTTAEVVGEQLLAVPAAGGVLDAARGPVPVGLLAGAGALLVLRARRSGRRRSGAGSRSRPAAARVPAAPRTSPTPSPGLWQTASGRSWSSAGAPRLVADAEGLALPAAAGDVAVVGLLCCVATLAVTALLPTAQTRADQPVQTSLAFGYRATAPVGLVYADGRVATGEPLFLDVVQDVVVGAELDLALPAGALVTGSWQLAVDVADSTGWSTRALTTAPVALTAQRQEVRLRPRELLGLAEQASALTGLEPGARTLHVRALVTATARRGDATAALSTEPSLGFALEPKVLRLLPDAALSHDAEAALPVARAPQGARVALGPLVLPTGPVRAVALVLGAGCLLLLVAARGATPWRDELSALRRRSPGLLVPTGPLLLHGPVVEVDDVAALARIAARYERLVLVHEGEHERVLVVQDDGTSYRHVTPRRGARPSVVLPAPRPAEQEQEAQTRA